MKLSNSVRLAGALIALTVGIQAKAATQATLKISAFNIRYYGLGGAMAGTPADEHRDGYLREFISSELAGVDVMAFEEIVDVERLQKNVVPAGWGCVSYKHNEEK